MVLLPCFKLVRKPPAYQTFNTYVFDWTSKYVSIHRSKWIMPAIQILQLRYRWSETLANALVSRQQAKRSAYCFSWLRSKNIPLTVGIRKSRPRKCASLKMDIIRWLLKAHSLPWLPPPWASLNLNPRTVSDFCFFHMIVAFSWLPNYSWALLPFLLRSPALPWAPFLPHNHVLSQMPLFLRIRSAQSWHKPFESSKKSAVFKEWGRYVLVANTFALPCGEYIRVALWWIHSSSKNVNATKFLLVPQLTITIERVIHSRCCPTAVTSSCSS